MKKSFFILLILLITFTQGFAGHKKKKIKVLAKGNQIESISMKKGACFGRCPVYQIDINKNGLVIYSGIRFTQDSGAFQKNVGAATVKKLFDQFNQYRVDTCMDTYPLRVSDLSGTYYTVKYTDKTKRIGNANFGPSFFIELTDNVNQIATVDKSWKRVTQ